MCVWSFEWKSETARKKEAVCYFVTKYEVCEGVFDTRRGAFRVYPQWFDFSLINFQHHLIRSGLLSHIMPFSPRQKSKQSLGKNVGKSWSSALRPRLYSLASFWLQMCRSDWKVDMIPWLLQPAWASFTWQTWRLPLSSFFSGIKKPHRQTEFIVLFYFSPQKAILSFAVTALRLRLRLLLGSDKVKQPALCYQGKGHLFKVSGLDGLWASKSWSLFSTYQFYRTGRKSDIQTLQRETERASSSDLLSDFPALLLGHFWNPSPCLWASMDYAGDLI